MLETISNIIRMRIKIKIKIREEVKINCFFTFFGQRASLRKILLMHVLLEMILYQLGVEMGSATGEFPILLKAV